MSSTEEFISYGLVIVVFMMILYQARKPKMGALNLKMLTDRFKEAQDIISNAKKQTCPYCGSEIIMGPMDLYKENVISLTCSKNGCGAMMEWRRETTGKLQRRTEWILRSTSVPITVDGSAPPKPPTLTSKKTNVKHIADLGWLTFNLTILTCICGIVWVLLWHLYNLAPIHIGFWTLESMPVDVYRNYLFIMIAVICVIHLALVWKMRRQKGGV